MTVDETVPSSFRDPSGFLFTREGILYRQVNQSYREHFDLLMSSGLYESLTNAGLLISHREVDLQPEREESAYKILQPETVPFISYPYEWCFSQFRDAALLTLEIQQRALSVGMSLKDASAYNVQFVDGRPLLIDTLSFERYSEGAPWIAYRQFCQHFLAPLALMSYTDVRLSQLLRAHIDGVPLDLAGKLLPLRTKFKPGLAAHIHLHARTQQRYAHRPEVTTRGKMSLRSQMGLIESLRSSVARLRWKAPRTEWGEYYDITNYSDSGFEHKKETVTRLLEQTRPSLVWDLGANTGVFSRLAPSDAKVVAFDIDPVAVEANYLRCRGEGEANILPLLLDLTNPSPAIGWDNRERMSLGERVGADTILALALVHHLAISNNLPLEMIARWLAQLAGNVIIEFVPKSDSQVQRLLASREDIFPDYTSEGFESAIAGHFSIVEKCSINETERTLYLLETNNGS